jgi:hypothetical protein
MDFHGWEPRAQDVFSDYEYYPPLYISDTGFSGSQVLKEVKAVIDKIAVVPPLTIWYRRLAQAHAQAAMELRPGVVNLPQAQAMRDTLAKVGAAITT